ncbi:MAG: hypothetical protein JO061_17425 [Acidobacteriaceae bacterium]|nr:hypothetical protein [Acidobacteriaceae bacterium]
MKINVKTTYWVAALAISASGLMIAGKVHVSERDDALIVHEWGTFTSVAASDGSAEDWGVLDGKDDLPSFVNDRGYRGFKRRLEGTVRLETPVLYFYSPREVNAHVRVSFPKGLITEWYPKAEYQVDRKTETGALYRLPASLNGIDFSMMSLIGGIEWKSIRIEPGATPDLPREHAPSRYYAARATDASPVTVDGEHEKFLFYRGVGRFSVPLSARLSQDGNVVLENCGDEVPIAMLFENRGGRFGYRMTRAVSGEVTLSRPALGTSFDALAADLENALVRQGLFRKEAQAMIATWRDSWFEEGSRVIYIVPTGAVNAVLPIQIDPVPAQIRRVFVGRMELITAETMHRVEAAIAANDQCLLDRYGRFLDPILKRIVLEDPAHAREIEQFRANTGAVSSVCSVAVWRRPSAPFALLGSRHPEVN